jgi:hypothetical protein
MDETDHGLTPRIPDLKVDRKVNKINNVLNRPAPVLGLRTVTYCIENEGTPAITTFSQMLA